MDVCDPYLRMVRLSDPVGMREISDRLGYPETSVRQWQARRLLPAHAEMKSTPLVWDWVDVLRWAHGTGRDDRLRWFRPSLGDANPDSYSTYQRSGYLRGAPDTTRNKTGPMRNLT